MKNRIADHCRHIEYDGRGKGLQGLNQSYLPCYNQCGEYDYLLNESHTTHTQSYRGQGQESEVNHDVFYGRTLDKKIKAERTYLFLPLFSNRANCISLT